MESLVGLQHESSVRSIQNPNSYDPTWRGSYSSLPQLQHPRTISLLIPTGNSCMHHVAERKASEQSAGLHGHSVLICTRLYEVFYDKASSDSGLPGPMPCPILQDHLHQTRFSGRYSLQNTQAMVLCGGCDDLSAMQACGLEPRC